MGLYIDVGLESKGPRKSHSVSVLSSDESFVGPPRSG